MYLFLENDQHQIFGVHYVMFHVNSDCFKNCHENEDIYLDEK